MDFPDDFPPDCPPEAASAASGVVFRFVKTDPPTPSDFLSHFELKKILKDKNLECQFHGLSVYITETATAEASAKVPGLRKLKVAKGRLSAEWGQLLKTPGMVAEHHTWWLPKKFGSVEKLFVVVNL